MNVIVIIGGQYLTVKLRRAAKLRYDPKRYFDRDETMRAASFECAAILVLAALSPLGAGAQVNPLGLKPHHITASVLDLDRAEAWYRNMLGFEVRERGSHGTVRFVEMTIPGFGVALVKLPGSEASGGSARPIAPRWLHIVFSVPNPDAAYRALKNRGAAVSTRQDPAKELVNTFLIEDSEGNEIEIVAGAAY
jgi:catechol 2,3-dioxygenase-like lactoylglutathione lyase family enzyme